MIVMAYTDAIVRDVAWYDIISYGICDYDSCIRLALKL